MSYIVVESIEDGGRCGVTGRVNDLISQGYTPLGGISIWKANNGFTHYAQAMIRNDSL